MSSAPHSPCRARAGSARILTQLASAHRLSPPVPRAGLLIWGRVGAERLLNVAKGAETKRDVSFLETIIRRRCCASFLAAWQRSLPPGKANIGTLGARPKWSVLEKYQETITRADFLRLLDGIYCTHGRPERLISVGNDSARILTRRDPDEYFTLRFAPNEHKASPGPASLAPGFLAAGGEQ